MRKMPLPLVLLCAVAALSTGCVTDAPFVGRLISKTSGAPIADALITTSNARATTDKNGEFRIEHVPLRGAVVGVVPPGAGSRPTSVSLAPQKDSTVTIELPDSSLRVTVRETAASAEAVSEATASVGQRAAILAGDGTIVLKGVPAGDTTVTIQSPGHETTSIVMALSPGENSLVATLSLTATETYQRYYDAYSFGHYKTAYKFLHKDVRKKESYKRFVADMGSGGTSVSLRLGKTRILKKWRSGYTKRTYSNVTEIDRTFVSEWLGRKFTDKMSQHWVRLDGKWFMVWNF